MFHDVSIHKECHIIKIRINVVLLYDEKETFLPFILKKTKWAFFVTSCFCVDALQRRAGLT